MQQHLTPATPGWEWALRGAAGVAAVAALANLLAPRRQWPPAIGPGEAFHVGQQGQLLPGQPSRPKPLALQNGSSAAKGAGPDEPSLEEVSSCFRKQATETRDATAQLKRTLDEQQKDHKAAMEDIRKKLEHASQTAKSSGGSQPPLVIAEESLQMFKSLIRDASGGESEQATLDGASEPAGSATCASVVAAERRRLLEKVDHTVRQLLRSAGSRDEARRSLLTISLIMHNVVQSPADKKFREVDPKSATFRKLGGAAGDGRALLQLAGFQCPPAGVFSFAQERSLDDTEVVRDHLHDAVRDIDRRYTDALAAGGDDPKPEVHASTSRSTDAKGPSGNPIVAPAEPRRPARPWETQAPVPVPCKASTVGGDAGVGLSSSSSALPSVATAAAATTTAPAMPWLSTMSQSLGRPPVPASAQAAHPPAEAVTGG